MEIYDWLLLLDNEEIKLIKILLLCSCSLKSTAKVLNISYPTLRKKINTIINKIEVSDKSIDSNLISYINHLAINGDLNIDHAEKIIELYKE